MLLYDNCFNKINVFMCFHTRQEHSEKTLEQRFKASFKQPMQYEPSLYVNGFTHPHQAVITAQEPTLIQMFRWGLIPHWSKLYNPQINTLNAVSETLHNKPSFKHILHQRCIIPADGFYEWQWLDTKGKKKQKYLLCMPNGNLFSFAGLWDTWKNKDTGREIHSYTILTIAANELMQTIHNSKKRMPIVLSEAYENKYLAGADIMLQNDNLIAVPVDDRLQAKLF